MKKCEFRKLNMSADFTEQLSDLFFDKLKKKQQMSIIKHYDKLSNITFHEHCIFNLKIYVKFI